MLEQKKYETILIDKRDNGVARATLNRPERLNAVDGRMHYELSTLWLDANDDPEVKVLLVTGQGRGFCSGGDFGPNRKPGPGGPGAMMR
jgi:enoyl-CoA hydratase